MLLIYIHMAIRFQVDHMARARARTHTHTHRHRHTRRLFCVLLLCCGFFCFCGIATEPFWYTPGRGL
jgi:hypothetical protein